MNRLVELVNLLRDRTFEELQIIRGAVLAMIYPRRLRRHWTIAMPGPVKIIGGVGE